MRCYSRVRSAPFLGKYESILMMLANIICLSRNTVFCQKNRIQFEIFHGIFLIFCAYDPPSPNKRGMRAAGSARALSTSLIIYIFCTFRIQLWECNSDTWFFGIFLKSKPPPVTLCQNFDRRVCVIAARKPRSVNEPFPT